MRNYNSVYNDLRAVAMILAKMGWSSNGDELSFEVDSIHGKFLYVIELYSVGVLSVYKYGGRLVVSYDLRELCEDSTKKEILDALLRRVSAHFNMIFRLSNIPLTLN